MCVFHFKPKDTIVTLLRGEDDTHETIISLTAYNKMFIVSNGAHRGRRCMWSRVSADGQKEEEIVELTLNPHLIEFINPGPFKPETKA